MKKTMNKNKRGCMSKRLAQMVTAPDEDIENPEVPVQPEIPETPEVPSEPEKPESPETPEVTGAISQDFTKDGKESDFFNIKKECGKR